MSFKVPNRTMSQCNRTRRTVLSPTLQTHSVNLHHGHAPFFRGNANQRLGGIGTQSPMNFFPTRTSTRSFGGISVSGTENDEGIFIPTPTEKCYELLEYIHDNAGLPWWLTILATTILLRGVVVFPFAVWQQMILARIENAQPMINAYVEQIKQKLALHAKEEGWSQRHMAKVFSNEVSTLYSLSPFEASLH